MMKRIVIILISAVFFGTSVFAQISGTTPSTRCGAGELVLQATATSGTIQWYTVPFYGSPVGTGSSFTTPYLELTATYYVDAVDAGGCSLNTGQARIPVIATISGNSIQAIIFYVSNTFCKSVTAPQEVTRTGTAGGTYSYTGTGTGILSLNPTTGAITPSSSDVGDYTVTYTVVPAEGCIEEPATTVVSITTAPLTSSIAYTASPYCTTLTSATVTLTNPNSGTFSASPSGLSINAVSGEVNPSLSLPGNYTVTYFVSSSGGCDPQTTTANLTITGLPTAVVTYPGTPFCKDITSATPELAGTGAYTGGTYSAVDLTINASTGVFNPSTSTAEDYTIIYTAPASAGCASVEFTALATINPLPTASISGTVTVCQDATAPDITFTGAAGTAPYTFTYKINDGVDRFVTSAFGTNPVSVTVSNTTVSPGTFEYTLVSVADANSCAQSASGTATITVSPAQVATFSYQGSPFCKTGTVSPTFSGGGIAGTFTKTSGTGTLSITAETGEINLAASDAGSYTITNTLSACGAAVATYDIVINPLPSATISGTLTACVTTTLTASTDATNKTYVWYKGEDIVNGETTSTLVVTETAIYKVKVTNTDTQCEYTSTGASVTINPLPVVTITGSEMACVSTTLTAAHNVAVPSFIWYKDLVSAGTNATLLVTEAGSYTVQVTNTETSCVSTSPAVNVTIFTLPTASILAPDPATVCAGAAPVITFTGSTGVEPYTFTYTINSGSDLIVSTVSGNSVTVDVPTTEPGTFIYTLKSVRDASFAGCEKTYSGVTATATVVADPTLSQPDNVSICRGGTTTLTTAASNGTGTYAYQWQYSANGTTGWANVADATPTGITYAGNTTTSLVITGNGSETAVPNYYKCVLTTLTPTGAGCNAETAAVTVTSVTDPSWASITAPATSITYGSSVTFSATVNDGLGGTITWIRSTTSGAAGTTVESPDSPPAAGTYYYRPHFAPTGSGCNLIDGTETTVVVGQKALTAATTVAPKAYDASAVTGTVTLGTVTGLVGSETLVITPTAADYADANIGTGKATTISYSLANGTNGGLATNYSMANLATTGDITAIQLTIANPTLTLSKEYNATTTAVVTAGALTGVVAGETANVSVSATANYADANVGTGKTITVVYTITGSAIGNYIKPADYIVNTGIITARPLTAATTVASKAYNASAVTGTVTLGTVTGLIGSETLGITPTAANFANANVGTGKATTISYALVNGTGLASNYSMANLSTTGDITAKQLTIANPALTTTKTYDGNTTAAVTPGALSGVETVDDSNVGVTAVATYNDATVAANKTITVVYTLTGTAAGNYIKPVNYSVTNGQINPVAPTGTSPQTFCSGN